MQFTINRENFLAVLQDVCNVVERNQTLPILSNILIKLANNQLTCIATDLEIEITSSIEIESSEVFQFTLPARKILDLIKALPKEIPVTISVDDKKAIVSTASSRYRFSLLLDSEFPAINKDIKVFTSKIELPANTFKELIESTQFCMAVQDIRYYLIGLFIRFSANKILAVGTDGHRLGKYELTTESTLNDFELLLPRKSVLEISRVLPKSDKIVTIESNAKLFSLKFDNYIFISKLIDSDYPEYQRVYPKLETNLLTVNRLLLKEALSRALILTNRKVNAVRLKMSLNTLDIHTQNPEQEEAKERLEVEYNGTNLEMGFNISYFIDILNHLHSEQIEIHLADADSSCIIKDQDNTFSEYILMPIKF